MNILVCIKHVPDTETRVRIHPDGLSLDLSGANWIPSPYDEFAVEEALRIREKQGGEVAVLSVGGEDAGKSLRQALAMGADRAALCSDGAFEGCDPMGVARILAAACRKQPFDLILCGKQGAGDDNQQVPSLLAELLGIGAVTVVTRLEFEGAEAICQREIEGGLEVVRTKLPAVISCQKGLNEPRYPSLKGIMAAKKKELAVWSAAGLGIDTASVGAGAAFFGLRALELPPSKPSGRLLQGDADAQVRDLVRLLREEAKVL